MEVSERLPNPQDAAESVIRALDTAWSNHDVEGVLGLFTDDATLESPLILRFLNRSDGVCRGRDEIRALVAELVRRGTPWGKHERPLVRGNTVVIEFRSANDDQPYSVDFIELKDGKIQALRAYAGWRALAS
jgi:ketosteroid isomerase-like protein